MTIWRLMEALRDEIKEAVKEYETAQPSGTKDVAVYAGFPPERDTPEEQESFIYCLVNKWTDTGDSDQYSTAAVEIGFNVYHEGEMDALANLLEHVRQHLLAHRIVANRYALMLPLKGEIPTQQPYPNWIARIEASYSVGQPSYWG